jgi:ATP-dependent Clp protease ATP-binding subunit ClpA
LFERFSKPARDVVIRARSHALRMNQAEVRGEHLLLGLAEGEAGIAARVLEDNGLTPKRIDQAIANTVALESKEGPLTRADVEALKSIGVDLDEVIAKAQEAFGPRALEPPSGRRQTPDQRVSFSSEAKRALRASLAEARRQGSDSIGPDHLLLGLLAPKKSLALEVLALFDVTPASLRAQVLIEDRRAS